MASSIQKTTLKRFGIHTALALTCCAVAALLLSALEKPVKAEGVTGASVTALSTPALTQGVTGRPREAGLTSSAPNTPAPVSQGAFWGAWLLGLGAAVLIGADTLGSLRSTGADKR